MTKNPFYVYALKDPTQNPAKPFYIGKGTGNRAWEHELVVDDSEKGQVIQSIHDQGSKVLHSILVDNLSEESALRVEAELIAAFGVRSQGGLLTNRVQPNPDNIRIRAKVNLPEGCYERAQNALEMLKSSVLELTEANPTGVKNSDVAKLLGLQSDYGGGSKDYLSYSILGVLMREGKIIRTAQGRHVLSIARIGDHSF